MSTVRKATNHIFQLIDEGVIDSESFLKSLLLALSEQEVLENLEYIQRVEDWDKSMRFEDGE